VTWKRVFMLVVGNEYNSGAGARAGTRLKEFIYTELGPLMMRIGR
jgi:hypothetical protein